MEYMKIINSKVSKYKVLRTIDSGTFATVYLAQSIASENEFYAIKIYKNMKDGLSKDFLTINCIILKKNAIIIQI